VDDGRSVCRVSTSALDGPGKLTDGDQPIDAVFDRSSRAWRWARSVEPHRRRSMDARGRRSTRASSDDLHVAGLRAPPRRSTPRPPLGPRLVPILFFRSAVRRRSCDGEIAGPGVQCHYSTGWSTDGGSVRASANVS